MEYYFDRAEHWPKASPQQIRFFGWLTGINIFAASVYLWIYWSAAELDSLSLLTGGCFLFSGIMTLLLWLRKMKPFITRGQAYLRIDNSILHNKLQRFGAEKRINLSDINYVEFGINEILFHLKNGQNFFLKLSSINNMSKREEFEQLIKNRFSTI